jgi:acyl-CoA synthetase (AMP-forming)/AMP-acid ligase II
VAVAVHFCHTMGSLLGIILGLCHGITCVVAVPVFDARRFLEAVIKERRVHFIDHDL